MITTMQVFNIPLIIWIDFEKAKNQTMLSLTLVIISGKQKSVEYVRGDLQSELDNI